MSDSKVSAVKVAVRVRPLNFREQENDATVIISMDKQEVSIKDPKFQNEEHQECDKRLKTREFVFDYCFWSVDKNLQNNASQQMIFEQLGVEVLNSVFDGYNACVLAYGQSGSGKTYTMFGSEENEDEVGLIPRICKAIFEKMDSSEENEFLFRTSVSYMEIYNEHVYDLLNCHVNRKANHRLKIREHPKLGPYVQDLSEHLVNDNELLAELLEKGNNNRSVAATQFHQCSSRGHAIFTLHFTLEKIGSENPDKKTSKIHLVDLAGSERANTEYDKTRLKEGANINKSLVTLGSVISTLAEKSESTQENERSEERGAEGSLRRKRQPFIPYRDSTLTWILKDTLGGNSKTFMIATVSPSSLSFYESLSTLRYAQRAKRIVNKPVINEDPNLRIIRELRLEIRQLKSLLGNSGIDVTQLRRSLEIQKVEKHTFSRCVGTSNSELTAQDKKHGNSIEVIFHPVMLGATDANEKWSKDKFRWDRTSTNCNYDDNGINIGNAPISCDLSRNRAQSCDDVLYVSLISSWHRAERANLFLRSSDYDKCGAMYKSEGCHIDQLRSLPGPSKGFKSMETVVQLNECIKNLEESGDADDDEKGCDGCDEKWLMNSGSDFQASYSCDSLDNDVIDDGDGGAELNSSRDSLDTDTDDISSSDSLDDDDLCCTDYESSDSDDDITCSGEFSFIKPQQPSSIEKNFHHRALSTIAEDESDGDMESDASVELSESGDQDLNRYVDDSIYGYKKIDERCDQDAIRHQLLNANKNSRGDGDTRDDVCGGDSRTKLEITAGTLCLINEGKTEERVNNENIQESSSDEKLSSVVLIALSVYSIIEFFRSVQSTLMSPVSLVQGYECGSVGGADQSKSTSTIRGKWYQDESLDSDSPPNTQLRLNLESRHEDHSSRSIAASEHQMNICSSTVHNYDVIGNKNMNVDGAVHCEIQQEFVDVTSAKNNSNKIQLRDEGKELVGVHEKRINCDENLQNEFAKCCNQCCYTNFKSDSREMLQIKVCQHYLNQDCNMRKCGPENISVSGGEQEEGNFINYSGKNVPKTVQNHFCVPVLNYGEQEKWNSSNDGSHFGLLSNLSADQCNNQLPFKMGPHKNSKSAARSYIDDLFKDHPAKNPANYGKTCTDNGSNYSVFQQSDNLSVEKESVQRNAVSAEIQRHENSHPNIHFHNDYPRNYDNGAGDSNENSNKNYKILASTGERIPLRSNFSFEDSGCDVSLPDTDEKCNSLASGSDPIDISAGQKLSVVSECDKASRDYVFSPIEEIRKNTPVMEFENISAFKSSMLPQKVCANRYYSDMSVDSLIDLQSHPTEQQSDQNSEDDISLLQECNSNFFEETPINNSYMSVDSLRQQSELRENEYTTDSLDVDCQSNYSCIYNNLSNDNQWQVKNTSQDLESSSDSITYVFLGPETINKPKQATKEELKHAGESYFGGDISSSAPQLSFIGENKIISHVYEGDLKTKGNFQDVSIDEKSPKITNMPQNSTNEPCKTYEWESVMNGIKNLLDKFMKAYEIGKESKEPNQNCTASNSSESTKDNFTTVSRTSKICEYKKRTRDASTNTREVNAHYGTVYTNGNSNFIDFNRTISERRLMTDKQTQTNVISDSSEKIKDSDKWWTSSMDFDEFESEIELVKTLRDMSLATESLEEQLKQYNETSSANSLTETYKNGPVAEKSKMQFERSSGLNKSKNNECTSNCSLKLQETIERNCYLIPDSTINKSNTYDANKKFCKGMNLEPSSFVHSTACTPRYAENKDGNYAGNLQEFSDSGKNMRSNKRNGSYEKLQMRKQRTERSKRIRGLLEDMGQNSGTAEKEIKSAWKILKENPVLNKEEMIRINSNEFNTERLKSTEFATYRCYENGNRRNVNAESSYVKGEDESTIRKKYEEVIKPQNSRTGKIISTNSDQSVNGILSCAQTKPAQYHVQYYDSFNGHRNYKGNTDQHFKKDTKSKFTCTENYKTGEYSSAHGRKLDGYSGDLKHYGSSKATNLIEKFYNNRLTGYYMNRDSVNEDPTFNYSDNTNVRSQNVPKSNSDSSSQRTINRVSLTSTSTKKNNAHLDARGDITTLKDLRSQNVFGNLDDSKPIGHCSWQTKLIDNIPISDSYKSLPQNISPKMTSFLLNNAS